MYLLFEVPGTRLFAVPAEPRELRHAALQQLHAFSAKRRTYKRLAKAAIRMRMDRLLCRSIAAPLPAEQGFNLAGWLDEMRDAFVDPGLEGAVFWPKQSDRGRIYVHLFSTNLEPVGFAKISLDNHNDLRLIREAAVLRELKARHFQGFSVPTLLLVGRANGHVYIVMQPVPVTTCSAEQAFAAYPTCIEELAAPSRYVTPENVPGLSWWPDYRAHLDEACAAFHEDLTAFLKHGLKVGTAHGDLMPANVLRDGERLWIVDWEESCDDAPLAADMLGFGLAVSGVTGCSGAAACVRRFKNWWSAVAPGQSPGKLMPALAFRHARAQKDAEIIIRRWSSVR
jgi:hypothetical protein